MRATRRSKSSHHRTASPGWAGGAALLGLLLALLAPACVATAAPATEPVELAELAIDIPGGSSALWIDVEDVSVDPAALTVTLHSGTATLVPVALTPTAFGAGAIVPATAGAYTVQLSSSTALEPNFSLTAVDASGVVTAVTAARISLAANNGQTPVDPTPVDPQKPGEPVASVTAGSVSGNLSNTGFTATPWFVLAGLLLAAGLGMSVIIARNKRIAERSAR